MNIVETAQAVPDLSSLVAALSTAGLVETLAGDGPFTVFAPTNDAFDTISSVVAGLTPEALIDILTYHVVGADRRFLARSWRDSLEYGEVLATVFANHSLTVDLGAATSAHEHRFGIRGETTSAQVTTADVVCSNGVVHIVNAVLIPNGSPAAPTMMSIVETAAATPSLSTLVSALTTAGLVETLEGAGPFTVFAPTNDAFDAISSVVAGLTPEALIDLLQYHVLIAEYGFFVRDFSFVNTTHNVPENYWNTTREVLETRSFDRSSPLRNCCQRKLELKMSVAGTVTITTESGGSAQVTLADVACSNGVVHVVDAVLIPIHLPAVSTLMSIVETAVATPSLSTLVSALTTAGLVETLEGAGPFTVFAPTNDAFDAISSVVAGLTPEALIDVLKYHVGKGNWTFAEDFFHGSPFFPAHRTHEGYVDTQFTKPSGKPRQEQSRLVLDLSVAGTVTITTDSGGSAQVTLADIACSNGVVHVVDAVLIPDGLPSVLALSV